MIGFRSIVSFSGRLIATAAAAITMSGTAQACPMFVPAKLEDVSYADVVVVGRVNNYRIIRDEAFRQRKLGLPNLSAHMRKMYQDPEQGLMSDYARFDIEVDEIIVGQVPEKLSVTWNNSTFGEPDRIAPGSYLIALRGSDSPIPPLRGPSATILPSPDTKAFTLLQAPCSSAFMYEADSEQARAIRAILRAPQR